MLTDLKYAIRGLRQNPGFALLVIATLTAGMGGAASLFSFVNAWILEPLPFVEPDRLSFAQGLGTKEGREFGVALADYREFRQHAPSFESLSAWTATTFALSLDVAPERVRGARATANFFETLGISPALGRGFQRNDEIFGRHLVAIVSHGFWRTHLRGDAKAVGGSIRLNGDLHEVIGVLPAIFHFSLAGRSNVWVPVAVPDAEARNRTDRAYTLIGRRKPAISQAQAGAELREIASRLAREYPETNSNISVLSMTLAGEMGRHTGNDMILAIFLITIGLLLIACSNTANLLLVRASGRKRQAAIQMSMGASRGRLVRQGLFETLLLFGIASAAGALAGWWLTDLVASWIPLDSRQYFPTMASSR